jgi:hypothetical protein
MVYKISLGGYFCWWTISPRQYHPSSRQYLYTDMVYKISLGGYFCWWTISPRQHHPSSSKYLYTDMVYKISLCGYFCWWTINLRENHPSSSEYLDTDVIYKIYLLYLQLQNNLIIININVCPPPDIADLSWSSLSCLLFLAFWFSSSWRFLNNRISVFCL